MNVIRNGILVRCVQCTGENARTRTRMQTRRLRNREIHGPATDTNDADSEFERAHESLTRIKFIEQIQLGQCEIDTWCPAPSTPYLRPPPRPPACPRLAAAICK